MFISTLIHMLLIREWCMSKVIIKVFKLTTKTTIKYINIIFIIILTISSILINKIFHFLITPTTL